MPPELAAILTGSAMWLYLFLVMYLAATHGDKKDE